LLSPCEKGKKTVLHVARPHCSMSQQQFDVLNAETSEPSQSPHDGCVHDVAQVDSQDDVLQAA
jgi:hypothetical protein